MEQWWSVGRCMLSMQRERERERPATSRRHCGAYHATWRGRVTPKCTPRDGWRVRRHVAIIYRASESRRSLADRPAALACPRESLCLPASSGGMKWLIELHGISRIIRTSWIIPLTRQLHFSDKYRILMTIAESLQICDYSTQLDTHRDSHENRLCVTWRRDTLY